MSRLNRELSVDARDPDRQLSDIVNQGVVDGSIHVREVLAGLLIDGDTEGMDSCAFGFRERLPGVFNAVLPAVPVIVIRLPVLERDQQTGFG